MASTEPRKLCHCEKCIAQDPAGVWVAAGTYRNHQSRRLTGHVRETARAFEHHDTSTALSLLDSSLSPTSLSTLSPPVWTVPAEPAPSTDEASPPLDPDPHHLPVPILSRLELQAIRYELLETNMQRPLDLEFLIDPISTRSNALHVVSPSQNYRYEGLPNAPPYQLVISPANAIILDREFVLHNLMNRLQQTFQTIDKDQDHNFELQRKSVEKGVRGALDEIFKWKREIWWEKRAKGLEMLSGQPDAVRGAPVIETSEFGLDCFWNPMFIEN